MRLPRPLLIAGLAALALPAAPAVAQDDQPQKIFNLIVYGDDPCPTGEGEEIVVCARKPESERGQQEHERLAGAAELGAPVFGAAALEAAYRQQHCELDEPSIRDSAFSGTWRVQRNHC